MSDVVIRVESLTKVYKLVGEKSASLYNNITNFLKSIFSFQREERSGNRNKVFNSTYIKALDNVSFEVREGEVVGIIGPNGAGKTTLLRILAGITPPTSGSAFVKGKIGALLSLGVGFHPELSGRENIYINGIILGMKKTEVDKIFDDIVDFSELSRFIDTPIKYYSSGMQLRLGFAVAAFLEPDILLLDEILAVGDIAFQKKCLEKAKEIGREKRCVLIVSHNIQMVKHIATSGLFLKNGKIKSIGTFNEVAKDYINSLFYENEVSGLWTAKTISNNPVSILSVKVYGNDLLPRNEFNGDDDINIEIQYVVKFPTGRANISINIHLEDYTLLFGSQDIDTTGPILRERGIYRAKTTIPRNFLNTGVYILRVGCGELPYKVFESIDVMKIVVNCSTPLNMWGLKKGYILPTLHWETKQESQNIPESLVE